MNKNVLNKLSKYYKKYISQRKKNDLSIRIYKETM